MYMRGASISNIVIFMTIFVYTLFCFDLYDDKYIFNSANTAISLLIIAFFLIGVAISYSSLIIINKEKQHYNNFIKNPDVINEIDGLPDSLIKKQFISVSSLYSESSISNKDASILLRNLFITNTDYLKNMAGMVILLGLLGSFIGILKSIKGIEGSLKVNKSVGSEQIGSLFDNMEGVLEGVSIAFGTSILGVVTSIFLTVLFIFFKKEESLLMCNIETLSLTVIIPHINKHKINPIAKMIDSSITRMLPKVITKASDTLSLSSQKLLESTMIISESLSKFNNNIKENERVINEFKINNLENSKTNQKLVTSIDEISILLNKINIAKDNKLTELNILLNNFTKSSESNLLALDRIYNNLVDSTVNFSEYIKLSKESTSMLQGSYEEISDFVEAKTTEAILTKQLFVKTSDNIVTYLSDLNTLHESHVAKHQELILNNNKIYSDLLKLFNNIENTNKVIVHEYEKSKQKYENSTSIRNTIQKIFDSIKSKKDD